MFHSGTSRFDVDPVWIDVYLTPSFVKMGIKNFRVRASKLRGRQSNRWQKGHSSDSNPSFRRHRDAAASSLGLLPIGQSSFDLENKLIAHGKVSSKVSLSFT